MSRLPRFVKDDPDELADYIAGIGSGLITFDGRCTAGKTSLARDMAGRCNCTAVDVDRFHPATTDDDFIEARKEPLQKIASTTTAHHRGWRSARAAVRRLRAAGGRTAEDFRCRFRLGPNGLAPASRPDVSRFPRIRRRRRGAADEALEFIWRYKTISTHTMPGEEPMWST